MSVVPFRQAEKNEASTGPCERINIGAVPFLVEPTTALSWREFFNKLDQLEKRDPINMLDYFWPEIVRLCTVTEVWSDFMDLGDKVGYFLFPDFQGTDGIEVTMPMVVVSPIQRVIPLKTCAPRRSVACQRDRLAGIYLVRCDI